MAAAPGPRVADTSCLYAFLDADDAHHAAAVAEVERSGPLVVPAEVLVETVGLVGSRAGRQSARAAQAYLAGLPHAEFSHPTDMHEVLIMAKAEGLPLVDAAVLWHCRRLGIRAASFDKRLLGKAPKQR